MSPDTHIDDTDLEAADLGGSDSQGLDVNTSDFDALEQDVFGEGDAVSEAAPDALALEVGADPALTPTPPVTAEGMMPYGAYASEKSKRQEAAERAEKVEAEAKALRDELAGLKLRQQVEAQISAAQTSDLAPDPIDSPELHAQWLHEGLNERLAQQAHHQRLEMSDFMARQSLGTERVDAATQAFMAIKESQPWVAARIQAAQSPHAEAVKWHDEQQILLTAQQLNAEQRAASDIRSGPPHLSAAHAASNPMARPVIPPNIANRTNAIPAQSQETFEDIEQGLWG